MCECPVPEVSASILPDHDMKKLEVTIVSPLKSHTNDTWQGQKRSSTKADAAVSRCKAALPLCRNILQQIMYLNFPTVPKLEAVFI